MKLKRPAIRYHGGKWLLAPWIIQHFPEHRCYVEPFGGGASVLLRKSRSYAEVYNDLDSELCNLFRVLRECGSELAQQLELTPFARAEFVKSHDQSGNAIEQARRTVVRSFMGFGSNSHNKPTGFRSNSNRSGTTPAHDWANYPKNLQALIERLQGVVIENRDAVEVMTQHDTEDTLHYVDPPYVPETRDKGLDYRHEMTIDQHVALSASLKSMQGSVLVSGYNSELYNDLYAGWFRVDRNSFADGARKRVEVLWMNRKTKQQALPL